MDYLKANAPFWKREESAAGTNWVDAHHRDDAAAARWTKS
jgi:molybdopterin synthase catalytic subunit